jgi:hypothetical protein
MGHALSVAATMPGFIRTNDGTSLFYRDWGTGKTVVFVAPHGRRPAQLLQHDHGVRYRRGHYLV